MEAHPHIHEFATRGCMTGPEDLRLISLGLSQDLVQVARCLAGLDVTQLKRVLTWLILDHDAFFGELGEPPMSVRELAGWGRLRRWSLSWR
ncbi:hypothetical protein DMA15_00310 [Streptomyces sp. WAC 01529]|nr:hypothetical protein DMA15_00310 [Streptomyces sp. WAC 01529]